MVYLQSLIAPWLTESGGFIGRMKFGERDAPTRCLWQSRLGPHLAYGECPQ